MFKTIMTVSVLAAAIASTQAIAADNSAGGVINFTGAITDTTCTINGGKSADMTVALSPISVKDAGTTVGLITKIKIHFVNLLGLYACCGHDRHAAESVLLQRR